jgi:hypothetical protein
MNPEDLLAAVGGGDDDGGGGEERLRQERQAARAAAWEEAAVRKVLTGLGLNSARLRGRLAALARRELGGRPRLLFSYFDRLFPTFPAHLAARRVPWVRKHGTHEELTRSFSRTPFQRAWRQALADRGDDGRPLALVFPWPRLLPMVLVEGPPVEAFYGERVCGYYGVRVYKNLIVTLCPLRPYLHICLKAWQPEEAED